VTGRQDFELSGSGRTDAGVHALAQVAHLDVSTSLPDQLLVRKLNDELPADINILAAVVVPHRFHARHDAVARRYLYQIATRRTAFHKPFVWWVREPLDLERMRRAAQAFVGFKDFRSFAESDAARPVSLTRATGPERPTGPTRPASLTSPTRPSGPTRPNETRSTLVLVERLEVVAAGDLVLVAIEGSHFLWKMVRRLVGVLVEIGRGGLEPSAASTFLTELSDAPARLTAPASGLFLERIWYPGESRDSAVGAATPLGHAGSTRMPSTRRTTSA
jgi:tRNA pseudouridine38-40 synthase